MERSGPDGATTILVDTSPDLREQLLDADVKRLDAVLFTHDHADHVHGIDDLRPLVIHMRRRMPVYADASTSDTLRSRFGYCFAAPPGSDYPPILDEHRIEHSQPLELDGAGGRITAIPILLHHGKTDALGFRFDDLAYVNDLSECPPESVAKLAGLDILIVDALRYTPHPTHFSVSEALDFVKRIAPRRAVLTNMHTDVDYATLKAELPAGVEPAYDGMRLEGSAS